MRLSLSWSLGLGSAVAGRISPSGINLLSGGAWRCQVVRGKTGPPMLSHGGCHRAQGAGRAVNWSYCLILGRQTLLHLTGGRLGTLVGEGFRGDPISVIR